LLNKYDTQTKWKTVFVIVLAALIAAGLYLSYGGASGSATAALQPETAYVARVIDGDTLELNDERIVRLVGINTPERGRPCYTEAKKMLEELIFSEVLLESAAEEVDRYGRLLSYVYSDGVFVNVEMLRLGYAHIYGVNLRYQQQFADAENEGREGGCIWESPKEQYVDDNCIQIEQFDFDETDGDERVVFMNRCPYGVNLSGWTIKDEARHLYRFQDFALRPFYTVTLHTFTGEDTQLDLYWQQSGPVWNNAGDTLFLRDMSGGLVLSERY
jgi:micrococcal nuclease